MAPVTTIVGVFNDLNRAEIAVMELRKKGIRDEQIGIIVRDPVTGDDPLSPEEITTNFAYNTEEGAITGAVSGTLAGGFLGALVAISIPGLGPVLATAVVAGLLTGATAGAAAGGLIGALVGMGVPEEEAHFYESEVRQGRILVTVHTDDRGDLARDVIRRHGGYDVVTAQDAEPAPGAETT